MSYWNEQRFTSMLSAAILMIITVAGGALNLWLMYLIYRKRVRFTSNHFATYAILADVILCCIGAPVFVTENLFVIAGDKNESVVWMTFCMTKLLLNLFHMLLNNMSFVLYSITSAANKLNLTLTLGRFPWKRTRNALVWLISLVVPAAYIPVLVFDQTTVRSQSPLCRSERLYLPVLFVSFAAIVFSLAVSIAMAYRMRNSRRVFAVNLRSKVHTSDGSAQLPVAGCSGYILSPKLSSVQETEESKISESSRITSFISQSRDKSFDSESPLSPPAEVSGEVNSETERRPTPNPANSPLRHATSRKTVELRPPHRGPDTAIGKNDDVVEGSAITRLNSTPTSCRRNVERAAFTDMRNSPLPSCTASLPVHIQGGEAKEPSSIRSVSETIPDCYPKPLRRWSLVSQPIENYHTVIDLNYSTVSSFSAACLVLFFLCEFTNSLFVKGFSKFAFSQLSAVILYTAAAARPLLYARSNLLLWKHMLSGGLISCACGNPHVT